MAKDPEDDGPAPASPPGGTPRPENTPQALPGESEEPWRAYLAMTHTVASAGPSVAEGRRSFDDDQLLAGRFRIVRFISSGGMGEVYEAEDLVLHERVALKTIRSDATDERGAERFRREIHLARKVTHPNVCRIFDIFHHQDEGSGLPVAFLSMELLAGETLAQHLALRGRLRPAEALPLLRQMAAALDAAHARGVVHRDFKSGNVMLVPQPAQGGVPHVSVTDFGLALAQGPEESGASLSLVGRIVGTPAYMAPEQVKGDKIGPAADIYAFGVVAYEMVAGRTPFIGANSLSTATLRLEQLPPPPTRFAPDLGLRWERAILRCLERDPAARFARAADFCRAIDQPSQVERWRKRAPWAALALAAVVGAWFVGRQPTPLPPGPVSMPTAVQRRSVAVLGFRNLAARPEQAWLSTAISEMLASELAGGGRLRLIPGETVARAQGDLKLAEAESLAADTLARLRGTLAADLVVAGSYFAPGTQAGGKLRLDLRVQDTLTGEAVHSLIENGTEAELPALVSRCGQRLRTALDGGHPDGAAGALQASFGQDPRATRLYSEGLALLRHHEAAAASARLQEAVAADARNALAQSALADAWAQLGYQERARAAAQAALDLAVGLPREQRLQVEARLHEHSFDWPAAARTYRTLFEFFPDNVEYGLKLAEALSRGGRGQESMEAVTLLRRLPPPERDDPRIDLAEARAARALSDPARTARVAEEAARKGLAAQARLIAADARLEQSWAFFLLGEAARSRQHAAEARRLFAEAGDRNGEADATQLTAHILWMQAGDFEGAVNLYEEALAAYRASGNRRGLAQGLVNLAGPRAEQGDLAAARRLCEEALPILREISAGVEESAALVNLSSLLLQSGDLATARRRADEALAVARRASSRSAEAHALEAGGHVLLLEGRLEAAGPPLAQAVAIRKEIGERVTAATAELLLASIDLESGRPAAAAERARLVADDMQAAQQPDQEATARSLLARAELRAGRLDDARVATAAAERLIAHLGRVGRLNVEIAAAQAQAASGERARGVARLREVVESAGRAGQVDVRFEAWRALVELGEERPDGLAREARKLGYLLYAQPAAGR